HEEMRKDGSASQSRARGIAAANVLQVVGRGRADGDAGRRREEPTGPWWNVPSRQRINIAEAERQIDGATEFGRIEARRGATCLDLGDRAPQEARAEPLPAHGLV